MDVTIAGSGDYDSKQYSSTGASDSKEVSTIAAPAALATAPTTAHVVLPCLNPSFRPTQSGGSDRAVRDALYTRLYNIVNAAGSDSVAGDALADGVASRGALFKRLFTEPGVAQLDAALRKAKELTFDGTRFIYTVHCTADALSPCLCVVVVVVAAFPHRLCGLG